MTSNEIKNMIDYTVNSNGTCEITAKSLNLALNSLLQFAANAVGKEEDLEIPAYWADKILSELASHIEESNAVISNLQAEIETLKSNSGSIDKDDIVLFYVGSLSHVLFNLTKNEILDADQSPYLGYSESSKELFVSESPHGSKLMITFNDIYPFYTGTSLDTRHRSDWDYNYFRQEQGYSIGALFDTKRLFIKSPSGQTYEIKIREYSN